MLYILTISTSVLSFVTGAYETRVLRPSFYGIYTTATAIMVYFQLVLDFGFLISGTKEVAKSRENPQELSRICSSITMGKLLLTAGSALVLLGLCRAIPGWRDKTGLYFLFFLAAAVNALLPDYLYRGLEKMGSITLRTVFIKVFFTLGILLLLKEPDDLWLIPVMNLLANLLALVSTWVHARRSLQIRLCSVKFREILSTIRRSATFFVSQLTSTSYSALNTLILGAVSTNAMVGYYNVADKLMVTGKNVLCPISDSLYPYMVRNRDFKLVKKILLLLEPLIIAFCVAVFVWAEPLIVLVFGPDYGDAAPALRAMLPAGIMILPSYVLGYPVMTALGKTEHANYSLIFSSLCHFLLLAVLFMMGNLNMVTLAATVSVAETLTLAYRIMVILRNKHLLRKDPDPEQES